MGSMFLVLTPKSAAPPSGVFSSSGHQQHLRPEQEKFSQLIEIHKRGAERDLHTSAIRAEIE